MVDISLIPVLQFSFGSLLLDFDQHNRGRVQMRQFKFGSAMLMTMILVGCGGGNSDVPAKPKFTAQVSFGDSLSDAGSYKVGIVAALGGGQFTINAASAVPATPTNWTELTAAKFGLAAPCAAETGLDNGSGPAPGTPAGTVIPVTDYTACTGYAQGGSRVTLQPGIGNKALGGFALTVPVVTQISHHLGTSNAPGGKFTGNEIVFVMAGANDVFFQAASIGGGLPAASGVQAVQTAASELAADVKTQIIANGAKYVVVVNVPDIASTPYVTSIADPTTRAQTGGLLDTLVTAFNAQLKADLPDSANVLNVDAYAASKDEVANPGKYNLTNVTGTACNLSYGVNALATPTALGSSLVCNASNLNSGVLPTDHYLFADTVHPTPYGHSLFALYVLQAMTNKGWY
jgi:outer membrane lipase/esterase